MLCISFPSQIFQHSQHFPTTRGSTIAAWCWPVCRWSCKILGHWRYHGATACWDLDRKSQLLGAGLPCILGAWFSWQNIYNVQCVLVYYHLSLLMMMMMMMMIIVFTIIIYYSHLLFILFKCVLLVYYYYYSLFMVCYTFIIYHALFSIYYYYYYSYFTCYYLLFTNYLSFIMYYYVLFTIYYLLSIIYYNMWCVYIYIYMYRDVYQVRYSIHLILTQQVSPFFSLGFE